MWRYFVIILIMLDLLTIGHVLLQAWSLIQPGNMFYSLPATTSTCLPAPPRGACCPGPMTGGASCRASASDRLMNLLTSPPHHHWSTSTSVDQQEYCRTPLLCVWSDYKAWNSAWQEATFIKRDKWDRPESLRGKNPTVTFARRHQDVTIEGRRAGTCLWLRMRITWGSFKTRDYSLLIPAYC